MLVPDDYNDAALFHPLTRNLMQRIDFRHGGPEYDAKYPDGIPRRSKSITAHSARFRAAW